MRKLGVWGAAAVLALGVLAQGRAAAQDAGEEEPPKQQGWWGWMFGDKGDQSDVEAEAALMRAKAKERAKKERRRADARRARQDYLRRQEVVDRLKEVALLTDDRELEAKAEELNQRAWEVYLRKTADLPAGRAAAGMVEESEERPPARGRSRNRLDTDDTGAGARRAPRLRREGP